MTADKVFSCTGLVAFIAGSLSALGILVYQCFVWLIAGIWPPLPLEIVGSCIRSLGAGWIGLQIINTWILALPLSLVIFFLLGSYCFGCWAHSLPQPTRSVSNLQVCRQLPRRRKHDRSNELV